MFIEHGFLWLMNMLRQFISHRKHHFWQLAVPIFWPLKPPKSERDIRSNFYTKDQFWVNMNSTGTKYKDEER